MKPRMKPGKFTAIFGPLSAVALAVAIAVNPIADSFDVTLNNLGGGLGQGELVVNQIKGSENWDTNYVNHCRSHQSSWCGSHHQTRSGRHRPLEEQEQHPSTRQD